MFIYLDIESSEYSAANLLRPETIEILPSNNFESLLIVSFFIIILSLSIERLSKIVSWLYFMLF